MPEKARVFVAEDNPDWQKQIKRILDAGGHELVLEAQTLAQALKGIEQFEELGVQVAVIDGNLSPDDISGSDGQTLAETIKNLTPHVKTVGMSGSEVMGVDINVGKAKAWDLIKVITNL